MKVDVKPLSPELLQDFLHFFDHVAFADNPAWAACYCVYYHHDPAKKAWDRRTAEENRECAIGLVGAGTLRGFLAYDAERPVGWCSANDKKAYTLLATEKELWEPDEPRICSVVCFVIASAHRRQGVSRALLEAACAAHVGGEFDCLEAYPRKNASGDAPNYHGTLSLYEKAGFSVHRELASMWVVRRRLG